MPMSRLPWSSISEKSGPITSILPSVTSSSLAICRYSKAARVLAAELHPHVGFANHFAFEGGAVGDRHRYVGDLDLDAAYLDAFLHEPFGFLQVVGPFDLVPRHGDHMLVGGDSAGQDLGDDRVGNDRETEVDGAGGGRVLEVVDFAEGQNEGEYPVLVVDQDLAGLAAFQAAEGERGTGGEAEGIDGADRIGAEGHRVGVVARAPHLPR